MAGYMGQELCTQKHYRPVPPGRSSEPGRTWTWVEKIKSSLSHFSRKASIGTRRSTKERGVHPLREAEKNVVDFPISYLADGVPTPRLEDLRAVSLREVRPWLFWDVCVFFSSLCLEKHEWTLASFRVWLTALFGLTEILKQILRGGFFPIP